MNLKLSHVPVLFGGALTGAASGYLLCVVARIFAFAYSSRSCRGMRGRGQQMSQFRAARGHAANVFRLRDEKRDPPVRSASTDSRGAPRHPACLQR